MNHTNRRIIYFTPHLTSQTHSSRPPPLPSAAATNQTTATTRAVHGTAWHPRQPTSIDSSTALTTMRLLSGIASSRGTTIVCSLHQPRPQVYDSLDRVLLMSRGAVSFFGPPSSTAAHFVSVGRPLGGGAAGGLTGEDDDADGVGVGVGEGAAGVGLADAMLDVVGDAEMAADGERNLGRGAAGSPSSRLVVMPREELLAKVRCGAVRGDRQASGAKGERGRVGGGEQDVFFFFPSSFIFSLEEVCT